MTHGQLIGVATTSVLVTIGMLAGGVGASSPGEQVAAALRTPLTQTVAVPGAAAPVAAAAAADASSTAADSAVDDTATADDATVTGDTTVADASATDTTGTDAAADAGAGASDPAPTPAPAADDAPRKTRAGHVFVLALAGRGTDAFAASSPARYLTGTLRPQGVLLTGYKTLGRSALADRLALVSGQPPNADTRAGCTTYTEFAPAATTPSKAGILKGPGCAFPSTVVTVADQVTATGRTWRGYVEDLDKGPDPRKTCRRPASDAADDTLTSRPGDAYGTRTNPFVYFHSLLDLGDCDALDGPLDRLTDDLKRVKTTPAYSYVAPNLCHDGSEDPCTADGSPGGLAAADAFLGTWVPRILASPAFKQDGVLLITFAGDLTATADAPSAPGALIVSPFVTAGTTSDTPADPYAVLRTTEDLLALRPLAGAADAPSLLDSVLVGARIAVPGDD